MLILQLETDFRKYELKVANYAIVVLCASQLPQPREFKSAATCEHIGYELRSDK